jgi:hypothetical protein
MEMDEESFLDNDPEKGGSQQSRSPPRDMRGLVRVALRRKIESECLWFPVEIVGERGLGYHDYDVGDRKGGEPSYGRVIQTHDREIAFKHRQSVSHFLLNPTLLSESKKN